MQASLHTLLRHAELKMTSYDYHVKDNLHVLNRKLPCYIISYHKRGGAKLRLEDRVYPIDPGTVICVPPEAEHDHYKDSSEETEFLWWHFTFQLPGGIDALKLFRLPVVFSLQNTEYFEQVFFQFMEASSRNDLLSQAILRQVKALELLYIILDSVVTVSEDDRGNDPGQPFHSVMSAILNYPERPISLKELAEQLHMHPTYISNRFKSLYRLTPLQFQQEVRIGQARKWLLSTGMTVGEISDRLGYSDVQSFSKAFKTKTNVSPMVYRSSSKLELNL